MPRLLRIFFLILIYAFNLNYPPMIEAYQANTKFIPPQDQVLLIIGQDKHSIQNYIKEFKVVPGGFSVYTSIQNMDGIYKPVNHGGGVQHAQYLVSRYPNSVIHVGLYMVNALNEVLNGKYDENIKKLGKWMKKSNRPFYLRIGYEFDAPFNNYSPELYIKAYRYIADKLLAMDVDNVDFVWHSYAAKTTYPLESWYPGDQYVDWVAISYFSPYNESGMNNVAAFAKKNKKPLMIAESTPVKLPTSAGEDTWKRWYEFVFKFIEENDVKIFCYINCHWDQLPLFKKDEWGDARLEENYYIKQNWLKTIRTEKFLNASFNLFQQLKRSN
ncbi:MAG: hypothetical protein KC733_02780 [Candidatus Omnitrophica bacterium]|nr:hypothetical protein [Candidatus Omnitrophota bacterium]